MDDSAYFGNLQLTQWRVERATRLSHFLDKRARRHETRKGDNGSSSSSTDNGRHSIGSHVPPEVGANVFDQDDPAEPARARLVSA